jgi:hypothetical protein
VWRCADLAKITPCNDDMFSSVLVPLTLCLLGPMVEENGSFLNDDEENEVNKTKKMEEEYL